MRIWCYVTFCLISFLLYHGKYTFALAVNYNPGQNIWNKIDKSSKTGQDKKSLTPLSRVFWLLLPKFNFWKGDWALGYVSTQIWDFPNIFLFPKILSLKSFGNSWGSSYTKFAILDITFRFTCLIGSVLKHCKVPQYYDQDCSYRTAASCNIRNISFISNILLLFYSLKGSGFIFALNFLW